MNEISQAIVTAISKDDNGFLYFLPDYSFLLKCQDGHIENGTFHFNVDGTFQLIAMSGISVTIQSFPTEYLITFSSEDGFFLEFILKKSTIIILKDVISCLNTEILPTQNDVSITEDDYNDEEDYHDKEGKWGANISYSELELGNIVIYLEGGHVGIYAGQDEDDDDILIHDSNE